MSNETMTDVRALAGKIGVFYAAHESCNPGAPFYAFTETELEVFANRLRGEAAPEGQAVAPFGCILLDKDGNCADFHSYTDDGQYVFTVAEVYHRDATHEDDAPHRARLLYDRPQPAAPAPVAGDADE